MGKNKNSRIVIAGQVPPPFGGQNIMVAGLLRELSDHSNFRVEHLPFNFTPEYKRARKGGISKLIELLCVIMRLIRLRIKGPIDLMVFPPAGPQTVPLIRDLLLVPWILVACRKVCLHFHAAGISNRIGDRSLLANLVGKLYSNCRSSIVMADYNKCDPKSCNISEIYSIPHQIPDGYESKFAIELRQRNRILYLGHLCPDKGTPDILKAFGMIADDLPELHLELAGEILPPYSDQQLKKQIKATGCAHRIHQMGVLTGDDKKNAFGRASLFLFPSQAPYESFGLVMAEAMMWGLPVIATDWRGNAEVIGSDGILVPCDGGVASHLAKAIKTVFASPEALIETGKKMRIRYQHHFMHKNGRLSPIAENIIDQATV